MKLSNLLAAAMLSALLAACSSTDTTDAAMASAEVVNPDEVTCRTVVKTGTRVGTRICKTNRAWAGGSSQGRNMAEGIQRSSMQNQTISGN
jgi:hypothetical protein